ncbi:hypothetical protein BH11PSE10_BH11PSE10_02140 [soil metagenome]
MGIAVRRVVIGLWFALALVGGAGAQTEEGDAAGIDEAEALGAKLTAAEAMRLLALALPDEPNERYALLQRQFRAAQTLEDRPRQIALARLLTELGRGRPNGESWIRVYLNAEFTWGSSGAALAACEPFVTDRSLGLPTRATAALRQTYYAAHGNDRAVLARLWSRAQDLATQAAALGDAAPASLPVDRLQVRSEIENKDGNLAASVATLREAVGLARRQWQAERAKKGGNSADPAVADAYGWLDGSLGMLTYALVRQGRSPEAIDVAQANIALWRAGQVGDGVGARWNYRLATALVSTQQYEAGLAAANLSEEMLARSGADAASHTRWLARQEIVRALMGLKRWAEADAAYSRFLAEMGADALARTRGSDNRLLSLLAAKNGRLDEALEIAERMHRYRLRLYGAQHPQTQEAAGVRAVARLLKGDISRAMADYEALFTATLDNPGGWLDLDLRGLRGYVLGIAFNEFMQFIAERALNGGEVLPAWRDRALQIADRSNLGSTQRALTDSTARVLAATPALSALLAAEQAQRRVVSGLFGGINGLLASEDRLRREVTAEAFKALPPLERKPREDELKALRAQIAAQQTQVSAARAVLAGQREGIARQYPAYADLVTPPTLKSEAMRALLEPGEALLVIQPLATATLVWLVGADRADGHNGFHASRLTAPEVAQQVTALRTMLDLGSAPAGRPPVLQTAALHTLYRELLGPLAPQLKGLRSLIIATDGPLASLPLATLVTEPPTAAAPTAWLVRQMAVTQLPAASALQALRRIKQPVVAAKAMLGFGDPLFKPDGAPAGQAAPLSKAAGRYDAEWGFRYADVPPLPETRSELLAVAAALGADSRADLVLGAAATRKAVLAADLHDRRVIAFATHGLMPGELPGISKPALAMAADADERESPLLELDDVLTLKLNAQWVLLSACNTAAGEAADGINSGAMSGLVRGFFFAGARSVLATHWAVDSASAAALSTATFRAAPGTSRAESLRLAQLALIDGTLGGGRWVHPFYWAPYALFGDPAR